MLISPVRRAADPRRLFNRDFVLLWQGQAVSLFGTTVFDVALALWIVQMTGSGTIMGLLLAVSSVPGLLLGPIGGTFADRHSRRWIIISTDAIDGVTIVALAALMWLLPDAKTVLLVGLFVVSTIGAVTNAFFGPAITAAIPDLVPPSRLAGANALMQISLQIVSAVGQSVAGLLFVVLGAPILFLINGLSFLFSAVTELFITIPQVGLQEHRRRDPLLFSARAKNFQVVIPQQPDDPTYPARHFRSFRRASLEGFEYVWRRRGLRELVLASAVLALFTAPVVMLLPFYVKEVLVVHGNVEKWYGFLLAAFSVGTVLGATTAGVLSLPGRIRGPLVVAMFALEASGYLLLGLVRQPGDAMVVVFLGGMVKGFVGITLMTIVQGTTPSDVRGRVFGIMHTLTGSLTPFAFAGAGVLKDLIGPNLPSLFIGAGTGMMAMALALALSSHFRAFVSQPLVMNEAEEGGGPDKAEDDS